MESTKSLANQFRISALNCFQKLVLPNQLKNKLSLAVYAGWFVGGVLLDQLTKFFASSVQLNFGISFSLVSNVPLLMLVLTVFAVLAWMSTFSLARREHLLIPHALFFAGAFSNILDRWFFGGVRDIWWVPVLNVYNNLADWLIALSVTWVLVSQLWQWKVQYTQDD